MTTTDSTASTQAADGLDQARIESFTGELMGTYTAAFVCSMIDLGYRTGLFEAAARGPATSTGLAERAGLAERYVREWLGAVASAGILDYDATTGEFSLPAEHAVCLTGEGELNVAPLSLMPSHLAGYIQPVAQAFRNGGGVPYSEYRPDFTDVMDGLSRGTMDGVLIDHIVPLAGGLADRLTAGTRVADIGCGTGHATNLLAQAFPASRFVGYDLAEDALDRARAEASELGLSNVSFEAVDVAEIPAEPRLGAVFAFDAIHDQVDPAAVLQRAYDALDPGGMFIMYDIKASSHLENNLDNPMAPLMYAVSTLHCMTISLAHDGAGLGTVWGQELALRMLRAAGFIDIEVHDVPGDPLNSVYVAHRPA